jgi:hypothetical protein
MTDKWRYDTTVSPVFIAAICHRRLPQPVGQVAPQALPDNRRVAPDKRFVRELASLVP